MNGWQNCDKKGGKVSNIFSSNKIWEVVEGHGQLHHEETRHINEELVTNVELYFIFLFMENVCSSREA